MRKIFASATFLYLAIVGCVIPQLFAQPAFAQPPSTPLKVGVVIPLSGIVASMGDAVRKGVELFQSEDSANRLQIIFEDHHYDGKSTVTAMNKLLDKVDALVIWGNTPAGVAAPLAERKKIPTIVISMNPDGMGREHVISMGTRNELLIEQIFLHLRAINSLRPAAVYIDIGNVLEGIKLLDSRLKGKLTKKLVASDEQDFKSVVLTLKQQSVDAIVVILMPNQAVTFARQATALNLRAPLVGGDLFSDLNLLKRLGVEDVGFVYGSVRSDFIELLKTSFGNSDYFYESASGYSVAKLLSRLEKASNLKTQLSGFKMIDYPINGLRIEEDELYGLHITNDAAIYSLAGDKIVGRTYPTD